MIELESQISALFASRLLVKMGTEEYTNINKQLWDLQTKLSRLKLQAAIEWTMKNPNKGAFEYPRITRRGFE